jgi:two-component system, NarL family, response regulator YdfI
VRRVLVVAQSAVIRAGLESLIAASPGLEFAGSSSFITAEDFARQIEVSGAEVVLVELGAHDEKAFHDLLTLVDEASSVPVVVLVEVAESSQWQEALRAGVRAVLPHEATPNEIFAAVEAAAAGLVVLESAMVESLLDGATGPHGALQPTESQVDALTPREVEVLGMLAEGSGNKQIAFRLGISEHTVKFHVASIFAKLGASSRTEAVTLGVRRGLVML